MNHSGANASTLAMIALLVTFAIAPQQGTVQTFTVDGVERKALVFAPRAATKAPLVLGFHGHGGNMRQASRSFRIQEHWPEAIVIYPDGLPTPTSRDPEGARQGWQITPEGQNGRDLKFVDAILAKAKKERQVDDKRLYAMGHSNGGRFTYVLWATRGEQFAAFGPSGSPGLGLGRNFVPRSAFLIAGENDRIVSFAGQKLTADALRRLLGTDGSKAKVDGYARYEPGKDGLEMGTYFHPGGHEYPRDGGKMNVEFFKRHEKP